MILEFGFFFVEPKNTYQILFILILDFKEIHCFYHTLNCHKNVLIDELYETFFIFVRVSGAVDDAHLLYECAFPRLSGACVSRECEKENEARFWLVVGSG